MTLVEAAITHRDTWSNIAQQEDFPWPGLAWQLQTLGCFVCSSSLCQPARTLGNQIVDPSNQADAIRDRIGLNAHSIESTDPAAQDTDMFLAEVVSGKEINQFPNEIQHKTEQLVDRWIIFLYNWGLCRPFLRVHTYLHPLCFIKEGFEVLL